MRIAIVSVMKAVPWGGSEELWADMAFEALKEGHEIIVSVVEWKKKPERIQQLKKAGAKIFSRPNRGQTNGLLSKTRNYLAYRYQDDFIDIFKQKPDRILVSQGGTFDIANEPFLHAALLKKNIPWSLLAEFNYDFGVLEPNAWETARSIFTSAHDVFFVCERNRKTTERQLALDLSHASIVRNPVNLSNKDYVNWPLDDQPAQLACVARLNCNHKGQDVLFEALANPSWKERNWELNLYGIGEDEPYLKKLAEHFSISERVKFHGHTNDIRGIWKKNHLLVLPSIGEGIPLALVEATACGRAALLADVGGHSEWIENNVTGFVALSPSSVHLGQVLETAWLSREKWREMGIKAREQAFQKMDPQPGKTLLDKVMS